MRRLRGQDAAFLYGETPAWHMHVASVLIIDPTDSDYTFDRFKAMMVERLPQAPQFRWRPVTVPFHLDNPYWVEDPDFDPDFHIRRIGVPPPGGRAELERLVGHLLGTKLHRDRPLWEQWVIEGLEGGRVAVLVKVHHAVIDGVSGAGLGEILLDIEPTPRASDPEYRDSLHGEKVPTELALFAGGLVNLAVKTPFRTARFVTQSLNQLIAVADLTRRKAPSLPFQAPRTVFNNDITPHRTYSASRIELDRVRAVKDAAGVKLNDVVLAICSGVLRTWLDERGELPETPLLAGVPVSMRTDDDKDEVGNKVSQMFVSLATHEADPIARLRAIYLSSQSAKEMRQALNARSIQSITETAPPALIALASRAFASTGMSIGGAAPFNAVISNVPGPPFSLYVAGALLESIIPLGPLVGPALNITVFSYREQIDVGFVSCPEIVGDIAAMADLVEASLVELEQAVAQIDQPVTIDLREGASS